jgi:hypothetical protein
VFGDAFFTGEELLALEAMEVGKPFIVAVAAYLVRSRGRVEQTPSVRFGLRGIGFGRIASIIVSSAVLLAA